MAGNSTEFKAVILAGGSGERFWPLSTQKRPKQFLDVFGGESLIRQCVSRLKGLVAPGNVFVVTSRALVGATRAELPEVPVENIVGEPDRRDTGAAVALAAGLCGSGTMAVFPSDQLVTDGRKFRAAVRRAAAVAKARPAVVTLGIEPTYPATGFGYVDPRTGLFAEKPGVAKARRYVSRGFLWNAGMFIGRVETFRSAFAAYAPALVPLCSGGRPSASRLRAIYSALPRISFDFAVMEPLSRSGGVSVVPCDCGWDDVGGYGAFDRHRRRSAAGNVAEGDCTLVDVSGSICISRGTKVGVLGLKDVVVAATPDGVLVAAKSRAGDIKRLFAAGLSV